MLLLFRLLSHVPLLVLHGLGAALGWVVFGLIVGVWVAVGVLVGVDVTALVGVEGFGSDVGALLSPGFDGTVVESSGWVMTVEPGFGGQPFLDMVLPKISTNMSVWAQEPDADPLQLYLDSLHAFERLPDDVLVLPSHGKPFGALHGTRAGGLKIRLEELREHHRARLSETLAACATPSTAAQVMPILFPRKLDAHQLSFALGDSGQEFYAGLDTGQVGGPSSELLVATRLTGAVLGLRGAIQKLNYDFFIGAPVNKPDNFKTAGSTAGFSLSASF